MMSVLAKTRRRLFLSTWAPGPLGRTYGAEKMEGGSAPPPTHPYGEGASCAIIRALGKPQSLQKQSQDTHRASEGFRNGGKKEMTESKNDIDNLCRSKGKAS